MYVWEATFGDTPPERVRVYVLVAEYKEGEEALKRAARRGAVRAAGEARE
jgi:hypothetical protein